MTFEGALKRLAEREPEKFEIYRNARYGECSGVISNQRGGSFAVFFQKKGSPLMK